MSASDHQNGQGAGPARLTLITSRQPAVLSKSASYDKEGRIACKGGGILSEGEARVVSVSYLADLAVLLPTLGPDQALTYGLPRQGDGPILSRRLHAARGAPAGAGTRTRDAFAWPDGQGILMLDHDPGKEAFSREELVALIRSAAPGLAEAAMLWWPSASSHLCDATTEDDLTGLRGQRLYLMVQDAADIPRAGAALVDRLWVAGHGRIVPSVSGAALERCPIDAAVWQPERLDFAAGAVCGSGLVQRRGQPVLIEGTIACLDTRTALPDDAAIASAASEAGKAARAEAASELARVREACIEARADAMVISSAGDNDADAEAAREAARATIRRALDSAVLGPDMPVEVEKSPGRFETVTVGEILDDRRGFHGQLTRDPLEPDYDGGRTVGKLFLLDARPTLYSFARGGRSFRLLRAIRRIELVKGRTADATERTIEALRHDPALFEFGNQIAIAESGRLATLDEHALGLYLGQCFQFWQYRARPGGDPVEVDIDPPARLVRQILSLGSRSSLKPLDAVITAPTLRPDGSLLIDPGYDPATRLLLDPGDAESVTIPNTPSQEDVAAALARLMHPFAEFPVVDALARGGLLAALLTATVRPVLATAPAFAIDAPVQGSGKTLLASAIAALATGEPPEVWPHTAGRDDEEVRKRLFTALRDGARTLIWDNIIGVFDSAALAGAITAPVLRDRVLGRSESQAIPNRTLFLVTGNNLCPAGDLPRRLIPIRIDPRSETPFAREFDLDPLAYVLDHRSELVAAALTLMRGRLSTGTPRAPGRMASFEAWDDLVRQTVAWIGGHIAPGQYGDPLDLVRSAQNNDPEQENLFALLEALADVFPKMWFDARVVCQRVQQQGLGGVGSGSLGPGTGDASALAEALVDIAGPRAAESTRSIGKVLKFRVGRIVFGLRLVARSARNGNKYRVETVPDARGCGFGGFGGFESARSESTSEASGVSSEPSESNPPNPPNPHMADDPLDPEAWK